MPLDTFICGSCQDTFTDLNDFMYHKKTSCASGQTDPLKAAPSLPRTEIIKLQLDDSGQITSLTTEPIGERDEKVNNAASLAFLNDVNMEAELERSSIEEGDMGAHPAAGGTHLIILNRSVAGVSVKTDPPLNDTQVKDTHGGLDQLDAMPKKKRVGRSKTGEGKIKIIEAVPPTAPRPTVPETSSDGKLVCPQCKRTFTKERHFNTHKCLASSSYVDITKKDILKIDSEEEDDSVEPDSGAKEDEDDFTAPLDDDHEDEKEDEDEMDKDESDKEKWPWKSRRGKKRKRISYKLNTDVGEENIGARQLKVAVESMENVPIFKTEDEKSEFESCIDVDLSQVDNMFRIHIIEQELNELSGMVYNTPTMSSLSVYSCNICDKVFKSLSHIRFHCVTHTDTKPFKCNKCEYETNSKGNLYTHMRKHTGQFYRCEQCEFKTVNKSHLAEHQMTHDNRRSQCMLCQKDYSTVKSLINHIRKYHTDKRGKEYLQTFLQGRGQKGTTVIHQCHICNRKFKKRVDRDRHLFIHDIKDLPYVQQCELCDYWASRRVYLDKHYLKHRVIYCCAVCDQRFLSTIRLMEHLTSAHSDATISTESLLEECISRSLYLPEPLGTTSEGSKYVNLPEELRETSQASHSLSRSDIGQIEISHSDSSPPTLEEQSCDFVSEYRQFIQEQNSVKEEMAKTDSCDNDAISPLETGQDLEENGEEKSKLELKSRSPSLLMLQNPGSDLEGNDDLDGNDKENSLDNQGCPAQEDSGELDPAQNSGDAANGGSAAACEESGKQIMHDAGQKLELSKEEKIDALIKRLGYRNMSMQIFNKMRETFGTEECEFCGRLFYSKVDYEPHIRTHTGDKPFACANCSFRATTKDQLKKHSEREHEKVAFQCKECEFLAPTRARLWNHQLKHLGISGLSCPECPHKFDGMKQLRAHILNTHKDMDRETLEKLTGYRHKPLGKMGRRSFKCPHCPRVFIRANSELQKHIWIHEGIKPFACPICPYACRSKNNLQAHMLRHSTEKPFSCSECGKEYKSKTALRWHVRSHKGGKLFKCDKCPYEATQSSHLKRHMETHDVLKRFICKHCDFSANTQGYMKIHYAKSHKGKAFVHDEVVDATVMSPEKRVFKCLSCGYLFGNLSDLKRHLKIKHHVQIQDIAGMEQMQISEVEVVQYEDEQAVLVNKQLEAAGQPASEELQLQMANDDGNMSLSAVNLIQHLIGMSQGGENQLRVVNEDGEPLDITVQQDGQLLLTGDASGMLPGSQYVIQYYNPEEVQSPDALVSNSTSSTSVQLATTQEDSSQEPGTTSQFIIASGDDGQLLTTAGQLLSRHAQIISSEDSSQLMTIDTEGQLLVAEGENSHYVHSELDNYNSQLIISAHNVAGEANRNNSCQVQGQLSNAEIVDGAGS